MRNSEQNEFYRFLGILDNVIQIGDPRKLLNCIVLPEFLKLICFDKLKELQKILDAYRNKPYIASMPHIKKVQDEIVYRYLTGIPRDFDSLSSFLAEHFPDDILTKYSSGGHIQYASTKGYFHWIDQEKAFLFGLRQVSDKESQFSLVIKEVLQSFSPYLPNKALTYTVFVRNGGGEISEKYLRPAIARKIVTVGTLAGIGERDFFLNSGIAGEELNETAKAIQFELIGANIIEHTIQYSFLDPLIYWDEFRGEGRSASLAFAYLAYAYEHAFFRNLSSHIAFFGSYHNGLITGVEQIQKKVDAVRESGVRVLVVSQPDKDEIKDYDGCEIIEYPVGSVHNVLSYIVEKVSDISEKLGTDTENKIQDTRLRTTKGKTKVKLDRQDNESDASIYGMEGENRLVTTLFADISGIPASETSVDKFNECLQMITDIINRYEGEISQFVGNSILAFFGVPTAHENDPERAILASLEIRKITAQLGLKVSIGINTGMTYFGTVGTQKRQERTAYGYNVDLAKRLQESADSDQILVSAGIYRLTRKSFNYRLINEKILKGTDTAISIYEVLNRKVYPEKLRGIEGLSTKMIGRDKEFSELKEAYEQWQEGDGQIVSLIGEAGLGKSRLAKELIENLRLKIKDLEGENQSSIFNLQSLILEGRCISTGQPISYYPFIDILRSYFDISENDNLSIVTNKVANATKSLFPDKSDEILPLLGNLLSISFGDGLDEKLNSASPGQIRHQTLTMLRSFFETLAEKNPLLLILEDLHWADDLSLDLLTLLMDSLTTSQLMLFCVYRPEQEHRVWQMKSIAQRKCSDRYTEITLKPLSSKESRKLLDSLLEILPIEVKNDILKKSEGNPFFIEESIRSLIDRDIVYREDDQWKLRKEITDIDIPNTIQSVVLSRVDRLQPEARYILQCASVIGRIFKYTLLENLTKDSEELASRLRKFEELSLIYEERTIPELEYAFKHALEHEAVYHSILERHRKQFHSQVASCIERLYHERLEEYYEELAYHYSMTDDTEKTIDYLLKAGEKAKGNYANETAISYFNKTLDLLENHKIDRKDWKFEAFRELGDVYLSLGRTSDSEQAYKNAIELAKELALSPSELARLYSWLSTALWWQSKYDEVNQCGEIGLEILGDDNQCVEAALMNNRIAVGSISKGNFATYDEYMQKNISFVRDIPYSKELRTIYYDISEHLSFSHRELDKALEWGKILEEKAREINDLEGIAYAYLAQETPFEFNGDYKNSDLLREKAIELTERIGDKKLASFSYGRLGGSYFWSGDFDKAMSYGQTHLHLSEDVGNQRDISWGYSNVANIYMAKQNWDEAIKNYEKSIEVIKPLGNKIHVVRCNINLGKAYIKKGEPFKAIEFLDEAFKIAISTNNIEYLYTYVYAFTEALNVLEIAYKALGTPQEFIEFCQQIRTNYADIHEYFTKVQWYLENAEPSKEFSSLAFAEDFLSEADIYSSWEKTNIFGDCDFKIAENGGLEIHSANRRELTLYDKSAPRLMRKIQNDFSMEVCVSPVSEEKPQIGGLLIWRDSENFLRLDKGFCDKNEVRFQGVIDRKWRVGGRGLIEDNDVYLRLERSGKQVSAYCSSDGKNWFTCGKLEFPLDDPVDIGIYSIGAIDRTVYCGTYKDGTATLFRNLRIYTIS